MSMDRPLFLAVFPFLHSKNCPDIGRCGQGKDQTGKQNCRSCPFKLSVLSVIKICGSQLCKKEYCKDQINCREYNLVYHRLNLRGGILPCPLNSSCHISCSGCTYRSAKHKRTHKYHSLLRFFQITPKTTFLPAHAFGECCASLKMGKKIGQKPAIFQPNFCPGSTTSCGQTLLFLLFSTILHHYYTLNVCR